VDIVSVLHRGVIVEGDVGRLGQALGNLISNARHHGEVGKPINVVLHAHGLQAFLDVRNFAAPIPAGLVRDLMVPYKKRDASGLRNRTGLGLGLYLSARIAAEHGGALSYRYEAGEVVFTLMLKLFDSIESIPE
jgi:signal transduction histidine kinase